MLWPFVRAAHDSAPELNLARQAGMNVRDLGDPVARIPSLLVRTLVRATIERTGDQALGLRAGECIESNDFGMMGLAARNSPNLRWALLCVARFIPLLDDDLEATLLEGREHFVWQLRNLAPRPLPAVNDFQLASALVGIRAFAGKHVTPLEVHVRHAAPTTAEGYKRLFSVPVRFNARENALIFDRRLLESPIASANVAMFPVFEEQASEELKHLPALEATRERLRLLLRRRLGSGDVDIVSIARELQTSASTLRRRLAEQGTTYRAVLDQVRRDLALARIVDSRIDVGELAFGLGFSTPSGFARAFRRWTGVAPLAYREQRL